MKWLYRIISLAFAAFFLIPLVWMLVVSIKKEGMKITSVVDWFTPPYSLAVYNEVITETKLLLWSWNSLFVAALVTLFTVIIAAMAGFVLSKIPFRYKTFIFLFVLSGLLIPGEAILIPLYQLAKEMGILNSYFGLILPALASPIAIIVLKSSLMGCLMIC